MAFRSAMSYVINEAEEGFVAVDFDYINGCDELTSWELVDQSGEDDDDVVDDCVSVGVGEKSGADGEITGSEVSDVASECLTESSDGEEAKSVTELSMSPEYSAAVVGDGYQWHVADGYQWHVADEDDEEYSVPVVETVCDLDDHTDHAFHFDFSGKLPSNRSSEYVTEDPKPVPQLIISPSLKIASSTATDNDHDVTPYISGCEDYYDDEEEEENDEDLDDELVPYSVNGKLGRERMRKLGKRSCSKMLKTKRLTYNYNKAGCFRGKHGLGLKHSLI